jgi:hypothetical protein
MSTGVLGDTINWLAGQLEKGGPQQGIARDLVPPRFPAALGAWLPWPQQVARPSLGMQPPPAWPAGSSAPLL